jgi:hypothetical protein
MQGNRVMRRPRGDKRRIVEKGELVEVNYVLPALNYREKSYLFPKGTIIRVDEKHLD